MNSTYKIGESYKRNDLIGLTPLFRLRNQMGFTYENAVSKYRALFEIIGEDYKLKVIQRKNMGRIDYPETLETCVDMPDDRVRRLGI